MRQEVLVGIREACQILRVSETSLRQWTDEGKIKAFVTPGGHRRYLVADIKKFMSSHQKTIGIKDLVDELEDAIDPLREIAKTSLPDKEWFKKLDNDSQRHLADLGRNLLQVIIKYTAQPSKREETMVTVHNIGRDFGYTLANSGLSLTDSVEAFILHRDPVMSAAVHLMKRKETLTGRIAEAIPGVARVMDEALLSLITAHQQFRNGIKIETNKAVEL
jgi:excisionase family DNA binding protein